MSNRLTDFGHRRNLAAYELSMVAKDAPFKPPPHFSESGQRLSTLLFSTRDQPKNTPGAVIEQVELAIAVLGKRGDAPAA